MGKDPDARRDWGQEENGMTEDEMAGWHHRLDGHAFECTPGLCKSQKGYSALLESFRILTKAFTDTPLIFSLFSFYFENIFLVGDTGNENRFCFLGQVLQLYFPFKFCLRTEPVSF